MLAEPADVAAHVARLHTALELPGYEPVQGALADLFVSFGVEQEGVKRQALQTVRERLAPHALRWFAAQANQPRLPRISPLATRWSVLARPSADISTRARRCSVDDSRALAEQVIQAMSDGDVPAEQAFFHHCITCHDNLAFMLARRALLRSHSSLPADWETVSVQLQQSQELT
jgi:hypothetical protein